MCFYLYVIGWHVQAGAVVTGAVPVEVLEAHPGEQQLAQRLRNPPAAAALRGRTQS